MAAEGGACLPMYSDSMVCQSVCAGARGWSLHGSHIGGDTGYWERRASVTRLFKKRSQKNLPENRILGVTGLGRGTGVTHLCIMMANYESGVCQKKTAVLEWGHQESYKRLQSICLGEEREGACRILDVDYYLGADNRKLSECIRSGYQSIIIDFGVRKEDCRADFLRCSHTFVLASLSEWQIGAFWDFYRKEEKAENRSWTYLTAFGSEETRTKINKRLKLSMERVPLSIDAFVITRELMAWFSHLLKE